MQSKIHMIINILKAIRFFGIREVFRKNLDRGTQYQCLVYTLNKNGVDEVSSGVGAKVINRLLRENKDKQYIAKLAEHRAAQISQDDSWITWVKWNVENAIDSCGE